jgi:hypothetical protein
MFPNGPGIASPECSLVRVIPSRGGADSMAEGRDDIEHIHDQTLAVVAGMISWASVTE